MFKRILWLFLTLIIAIVAALLAAKHPTGPNTVSYDKPAELLLSIGMIIVLFLPPLILSLFENQGVRILSAVYQAFIVISFLGMIPLGFLIPDVSVSVIAFSGTIVSIASMIATLKRN